MALARGHAGLATIVSGHSRLQDTLTSQFVAHTACSPSLASPNQFPSQFCVSFSKGSRMPSASKQRLVMPRAAAAAASATMAQSMTRIADTFAALKQQGKVHFTSKSEFMTSPLNPNYARGKQRSGTLCDMMKFNCTVVIIQLALYPLKAGGWKISLWSQS